jgi:hypothetical protein
VFDRGRGDALDTVETIGGPAVVNLAVESAARGLGRSGARMRSDPDQRLINPDDGYFKNTAYAGEKMLYWGGKKPSSLALVAFLDARHASPHAWGRREGNDCVALALARSRRRPA